MYSTLNVCIIRQIKAQRSHVSVCMCVYAGIWVYLSVHAYVCLCACNACICTQVCTCVCARGNYLVSSIYDWTRIVNDIVFLYKMEFQDFYSFLNYCTFFLIFCYLCECFFVFCFLNILLKGLQPAQRCDCGMNFNADVGSF